MPLLPRPLRCDRRRMKGRFVHRNIVTRAMRAELVGELAELGASIAVNERACCCPAKPASHLSRTGWWCPPPEGNDSDCAGM